MKLNQETKYLSSLIKLPALDIALTYAVAKVKDIIPLIILPVIINILVVYLQTNYPLNSQQLYLLLLLETMAMVWALVSVALYSIYSFQDVSVKAKNIVQFSFASMPKVILSSLLLSLVTVSFVFMPFLFVLLVFLYWAPVFCAFEIAVKPSVSDKYRVDNNDDLDDIDYDSISYKVAPTLYFVGKSILDLGFARSVQFVSKNYLATFELLLISWFLMVSPVAIISLFGGTLNNIVFIILKTVLGFIFFSFVCLVSTIVLLMSLPQSALNELTIDADKAIKNILSFPLKFRFHRRIIKWVILVIFGVYFTKLNWNQWIFLKSLPSNIAVRTEAIELTSEQILFKLVLEDKANNFRWLDTQKLALELYKEESEIKDLKPADIVEKSPWKILIDIEQENDKYLRPERVMPFTQGGQSLNENNFVPYKEPLKLVLYFKKPNLEELSKYNFKILHQVFPTGVGEVILQGKLSNE